MPLPTPNAGESREQWLDRCMDEPKVVAEFEGEDQRFAVCNQIWDDPSVAEAGVVVQAQVNTRPTQEMADAAKRGLELRQEWGRGGTDVGVARARDISNRENLSPDTIGRMNSFFARHEHNYRPDEKESDGGPKASTIAWLLWGGSPGKAWAERKMEEIERAEGRSAVSVMAQGQAAIIPRDGDEPTVEFVLMTLGPNENGLSFTPEALEAAAQSIIGKPLNLDHEKFTRAKVGKIVRARFSEDRIAAEAVLFTNDIEAARAAHRLIKEGLVPAVSMEATLSAFRCRECGAADLCEHASAFGGVLTGPFEVQAMEFDGAALLDDPADREALITKVAASVAKTKQKEKDMDAKAKVKQVLGLEASAPDREVFAAVAAKLDEAPETKEVLPETIRTALELDANASAEDAEEKIRALSEAGKGETALLGQIEALSKQVKALSEKSEADERTELVSGMVSHGQIRPAQRETYMSEEMPLATLRHLAEKIEHYSAVPKGRVVKATAQDSTSADVEPLQRGTKAHSDALHRETMRVMEEKEIKYGEAMRIADRELSARLEGKE
jgi:hypothetical protein